VRMTLQRPRRRCAAHGFCRAVPILLAGLIGMPAAAAGQTRAAAPDTLSLARSIQLSLEHSLRLADAEQGFEIARQRVRDAWSAVLPDVSASASYARNLRVQRAFLPAIIFDPSASPDDLIPVQFGSDNTWMASFQLTQPIFEAAAFIGVGAAARFQDLEEERVRGAAQEVVTAVRQAYFDALLAADEVRLTAQSIERVRRTLEETRAMNRAGMASDYDVLRLEVQLANLEPNLLRARNAVLATIRTLQVEMGVEPDGPVALEGDLSTIDLSNLDANAPANASLLRVAGQDDLSEEDVDRLYRIALAQRSDVRQLDATITLEGARLSAEKADYYPKLSLFSSYDITAQENGGPNFFGESGNQRSTAAVAGLRLEVPIFTGFSRDAQVQQARATVRQNEARRDRLALETASQLRTLRESVGEARARTVAQQRAVAQARRGFEIASAEYRAGVGSQLQITDAEVALRESEFNYAQAVYDYLSGRARLEAAAGVVPYRAGDLAQQYENQ